MASVAGELSPKQDKDVWVDASVAREKTPRMDLPPLAPIPHKSTR